MKNESLAVASPKTSAIPAILLETEKKGVVVSSSPYDIRTNMQGAQPSFRLGPGITDYNKIPTPLVFHACGFRTIPKIRLSETYDAPCDFSQFIGIATVKGHTVYACLTLSATSSAAAERAMQIVLLEGGILANTLSISIRNEKSKKGQAFGIVEFALRKATSDELGLMDNLFTINPNAHEGFLPLRNIDEVIDETTGEVK
jgi:hypothetical protein